MGKRHTITILNAQVQKNSTFSVNAPQNPWDWDPSTHDVYKNYIGKKADSVKIADEKWVIHKLAWWEWTLENLKFGKQWKIHIIFEENE